MNILTKTALYNLQEVCANKDRLGEDKWFRATIEASKYLVNLIDAENDLAFNFNNNLTNIAAGLVQNKDEENFICDRCDKKATILVGYRKSDGRVIYICRECEADLT